MTLIDRIVCEKIMENTTKQRFHCLRMKNNDMKSKMIVVALAFIVSGLWNNASAQKTVVDIALGSKDHTTLVAAVKAAGLVEALQGEGPFTVFAPVNSAFDKLPEGTVQAMLLPENKAALAGALAYHVVAGRLDAASVVKAINDGGGKAEVKTLNGGMLTVSLKDGKVILTDGNGGVSTVIVADLKAENGVIHVIDTIVFPQ
jgi:uncharacterized surface protein with fasciclin (FAS1) repeats